MPVAPSGSVVLRANRCRCRRPRDLVELADLVAVDGVEPVDGLGSATELGSTALELIEIVLERRAVGLDGGDGCSNLLDRFSGVGGSAGGVAPMPEPGLTSVVVGAPHPWSQLSLELAFEVPDGRGVGLPRSPGRGDGRLQRLELSDGVGPAVLTLLQAIDEGLVPVVEPLPPRLEPVRHGHLRSGPRRLGFSGDEVAALGDGRKVDPVVSEDAVEDVARFGEVVVLGDDVDAVLVATSAGCDVQPSMSGRGRGKGDADVHGVALVAVFGGGVAEPDVPGDVRPATYSAERRRAPPP